MMMTSEEHYKYGVADGMGKAIYKMNVNGVPAHEIADILDIDIEGINKLIDIQKAHVEKNPLDVLRPYIEFSETLTNQLEHLFSLGQKIYERGLENGMDKVIILMCRKGVKNDEIAKFLSVSIERVNMIAKINDISFDWKVKKMN